tara:strand:- start:66 stop:941 length:876 start_codon:yes stop_codon:yes gene_type:complete
LSSIRISSPAKINLGLKILGLREDGFHEVQTHLVQVDLFDQFLIGKRKRRIDIFVDNSSIKGKHNIIYKAADLLREEFGDKELGATIHLEKKIPIGAGLGGGSGNAAFVLWFLNKLWGINYPLKKLESLAKKLGADVPFFLGGPSYIFAGKGDEKLYPCKFSPRYYVLIVKPPISLYTHEVYGWSREKILKSSIENTQLSRLSKRYDCRENDLEEVVFLRYPFLREYKNKLLEFGSKLALLSGSGSALFGIYSRKNDLINAFNFFSSKKKLWVSVVRPLQGSILKNSNFKF